MGKKRRTKAKRNRRPDGRRKKHERGADLGYIEVPSALQGLSAEASGALLAKTRDEADRVFRDSIHKLERLTADVDPVMLLSTLSAYGLTTPVGARPNRPSLPDGLQQHHVELVQAISLRASLDSVRRVPTPADCREAEGVVQQAASAFGQRRAGRVPPDAPSDVHAQASVLEFIRLETQTIRNPGYPQQVREVVTSLFSPLDDAIERQHSVRVVPLVGMWFGLKALVERRLNGFFFERGRPILRARSHMEAVQRFCDTFPGVASPAELEQRVRAETRSLRDARRLLLLYATPHLPAVYELSLDDCAAAYTSAAGGPVNHDALRRVLDKWSIAFGELRTANVEHFLLDNPVWRRPFVRLSDGQYFCPVITLFLGFLAELLEDALVRDDPSLLARYEKRRAAFLEEEVVRRFGAALPDAQVFRGSLWREDQTGTRYENDALVLLGGHALVVEAKAGRVNALARRGAPERVQKAVDRLVGESAEQAARFLDFLRRNPGPHTLATRSGVANLIDTTDVARYAAVNVTLDHFGRHGTRLRLLAEAGYLGESLVAAPTLSLYELMVVLETLESPSEILHYFLRRVEVERQGLFVGDELDLLAFYLQTGFNVGEFETQEVPLVLWGRSVDLDRWFMAEWHRRPADKPRARRTRWFRDMIARIELRRHAGWAVMTSVLLNVSIDDQQKFEAAMDRARGSTAKFGYGPRADNYVYLLNGPEHRRDLIVGVPLLEPPGDARRLRLLSVLARAKQAYPKLVVIGIGQSVLQPGYPFDIVAVHRSDAEPVSGG